MKSMSTLSILSLYFALWSFFCISFSFGQECSQTKLCATGCCSKHGFCGTTSEHCGTGCLSTCNWKPPATECGKTKLCATGCCSKHGFCGTEEEHCGTGCQSTCDFKLGCDAKNPCKDGTCCSKFGFCGLGPDFCSKDNCVGGCDAKTFCDPGGFGPEFAERTKCPLNVCCSKWGWCGLTEEFCGSKQVQRPACSAKGQTVQRVVGYYEGWAPGRSCGKFQPEDIPTGVYTHINFAFASIDPKTFKIVPASAADPDLFRRLIRRKQVDTSLKVFIAIGGWAFNDPGPTVTTFSDIARSEANQRAFILSLVSFINTYGFDGVDIDWEYPVAPDRNGRGEDFENLPKLLRNIRSALNLNTGGRNGLSIAIPASYWYLQHFDIKKIAETVDFFNIMTYDLHGAWDTPESWLGNHLNSHTNLTEIKDSMDLLWRNDIKPDQVNLGLAFYSRTFTASNAGCMRKGCLFDSGGPRGPCTDEVGVLSNSEVVDMAARAGAQVNLDTEAAVKVLTSGREWLTYDDKDTWQLKIDFARSQCLGGVMVWAISQDTPSGRFSKELQSVTGYRSNAVAEWKVQVPIPGGSFKEVDKEGPALNVPRAQCRWTNCGESCPRGWKGVRRTDPAKHKIGELMKDKTFCPGRSSRTFCCPPGPEPLCGWYFHNNGKCNPSCPKDQVEIGSTDAACNNGRTQVACCKMKGPDPNRHIDGYPDRDWPVDGMQIWGQCLWYGKEPDCSTKETKIENMCRWNPNYSVLLTPRAYRGSGAQRCLPYNGLYSARPYCCPSDGPDNVKWKNCEWYAEMREGDLYESWLRGGRKSLTCASGCPSGKIKVTLDDNPGFCRSGAQAFCCDAQVATPPYDEEEETDLITSLLKQWAKNPTCPNSAARLRARSPSPTATTAQSGSLVERQSPRPSINIAAHATLKKILQAGPGARRSRAERQGWNAAILQQWPGLGADKLANFFDPARDHIDSWDNAADAILCDMDEWQERSKSGQLEVEVLICSIPTLRVTHPELTDNPDDTESDSESTTLNRNGDFWEILFPGFGGNDPRAGGVRPFTVNCGPGCSFDFTSATYINGGQGDNLARATNNDERFYVNNGGSSCGDIDLDDDGDRDDEDWVSEHILELVTFRNFVEYTIHGRLALRRSRGVFTAFAPQRVGGHFPVDYRLWKDEFRTGFPAWHRAKGAKTPMQVLYEGLGSTDQPHDMVNCEAKLNGMKAKIWGLKDPVSGSTWQRSCIGLTAASAANAFTNFEMVYGTWKYLAKDQIEDRLLDVHTGVNQFLEDFEDLYQQHRPNAGFDGLAGLWREYMTFHFERMAALNRAWMTARIGELTLKWSNHLNDLNNQAANGAMSASVFSKIVLAVEVLAILAKHASNLGEITFNHDMFLDI